jgi:hypothetical protein
MTISAIASLSTIMRDELVIVTSTLSAEVTFAGRTDLPSPMIGKSKSSAEINTGRVNSNVVDDSVVNAAVEDTDCDVVSVVAEFVEQAEIGTIKSDEATRASVVFRVTIAISIY